MPGSKMKQAARAISFACSLIWLKKDRGLMRVSIAQIQVDLRFPRRTCDRF